jgi:hypothetical protein
MSIFTKAVDNLAGEGVWYLEGDDEYKNIKSWDTKHDLYKKTPTEAEVAAEVARLNKLSYQTDRKEEYPDWGDQLDYIYHNGIDKWKADIVDPVKKKYPKPE